MWFWLKRGIAIAVLGYVAYGVWDYYRAGYFTRPNMPEGAFSISYKSGLRAILVNVETSRKAVGTSGFPCMSHSI